LKTVDEKQLRKERDAAIEKRNQLITWAEREAAHLNGEIAVLTRLIGDGDETGVSPAEDLPTPVKEHSNEKV
jgi:hypothetical protein